MAYYFTLFKLLIVAISLGLISEHLGSYVPGMARR
jgi:hypothetical protein